MTGDTQVSIVNLALGHISQRVITSISDTNSVQAVAANRVWTPALGEALRGNDWAFARSIVLLVESATHDPTLYNYTYAYVMPTNCQALRSIYNSYTVDKIKGEKFERIYDPTYGEELILTDVGGTATTDYAYARYTYNITDVTKWDPSFVSAFSYLLAAKMAPILIGKDAKEIADMQTFYNIAMNDSQRLDSYEGSPPKNTENPIVDARA